jgi:hypothetical protein
LSNASGSIAGYLPSIKFFVNREDMGQTINLIELLSTTHRSEATIGDLNECFADRAVRLYWAASCAVFGRCYGEPSAR